MTNPNKIKLNPQNDAFADYPNLLYPDDVEYVRKDLIEKLISDIENVPINGATLIEVTVNSILKRLKQIVE